MISHPFILLIIGALVSSLLIPYYTRQWQDHQKELELKTDLSDQINKAISNMVTTARYNLIPAIFTQKDYNTKWFNAYEDWISSSKIIGSRIKSYFSNDQILQNWNNLSSATTEFVGLSEGVIRDINYNYNMCLRLGHIITIHNIYSKNNPINIDRNDFKALLT